MQIIVKKRKPHQEVGGNKLSATERASLSQRKQELEAQKVDLESKHLLQNPQILNNELKKLDSALGQDDEKTSKGKSKDWLVKRKEDLEKRIKKVFDPITTQFIRPDHPDYAKALKAAERASTPEATKLVEEFRNVSRRLEPEDPGVDSIEDIIRG